MSGNSDFIRGLFVGCILSPFILAILYAVIS